MRPNWMHSALLATAVVAPTSAQISVYIGTPPPAIRYEEREPIPGPGYVWVEGYWVPKGHHYRWVRGRWDRPPYEGAYWSHPHYDHYQEGWQMHEGHWDHEDHDDDHGRDHHRDHDHRGYDHHDHDHRGYDHHDHDHHDHDHDH